MRVLQIIHDFLPRHQAGSELYCHHLSKGLQDAGCDVRLLFGEIDHTRKTGDTRRGTYEGLPYLEVVQNHDVSSVRQTYADDRILSIIASEIEAFRPDIVHIHHLLGLGFPVPALAKEMGARVVMTLHDYWLSCARGGGQRYRGPGRLCEDVDPNLCAACLAGQHAGGSRLLRRLSGKLKQLDAHSEIDLLQLLPTARIETPDATFVGDTSLDIEGVSRKALLAHPPSRIRYRIRVPRRSIFETWVAVDPDVADRCGDGVVFHISLDGKVLETVHLHPRQRAQDRGWRHISVDLESWGGKSVEFQLETTVPSGANHDFCSAGWAVPAIAPRDCYGYSPSPWARIRDWGESVLGRVLNRPYRKEAAERIRASKELAESVDLFLAPSAYLADRFKSYGFPVDRVLTSDYGIWTPPAPERPPVGSNPGRPLRFAFVGTLVEHKGVHVIVEAFRDLPRGGASLDVYGNPDEFVDYTARLRRLGSRSDISFRGRLDNNDIMSMLAEADALVVPSIWFENSPITIHEAFLARVPVITSDLGGMAGLVQHGKNGFLFPPGDTGALRELLIDLIGRPEKLDAARPDPQSVKPLHDDVAWMQEVYAALRDGEPIPKPLDSALRP